jgi:hypothetical protein
VVEVRHASRCAGIMTIRGVETIGLKAPENPSCAFLAELPSVHYARLFDFVDLPVLDSVGLRNSFQLLHGRR